MRTLVLILCVVLAPAALAAEANSSTNAPAGKENFFKRAGKAIGRDAKAGWQQAKQGYSKSAKDLGRGTASAAKRVGGEIKQSAKRTGKAAKEEFK
jgi:hypothetical protein